jgi:adenylosuccinate synthase
VVGDKKYAFHLVPSGVLHPKCVCLLGNGVVVNLESLATELASLDEGKIDYKGRFFISDRGTCWHF